MNLPTIPHNLISKIQKNKVVIFVGAGLSTNSGFPNWIELTISILNHLKDKEVKADGYIKALNEGLFEPIEILGKIEHLKNYAIEVLEKEIKKHNGVSAASVHYKLGNLADKIVTTNYDNLLEKGNPSFEKITYSNKYKVAKISEYDKFILKIHGDIDEPDKCILFPSQYADLYSFDDRSSTFELKKIFSDKCILFIGFSLNDPYINHIRDYIAKMYDNFNPENYIITTSNTIEFDNRTTPLILQDYTHLEAFLDKLIEIRNSSKIIEDQDVIKEIDNTIVGFSENLEYDIPPSIKFWVGRKREIENISNENFKVIFITGIGGQGKSALASHFIKNFFKPSMFEFADWRDFKEESNRFQTKIISIIKRLTNNQFDIKRVEALDNKELVDSLFYYLGDRKIVFVFDNIDSYIDLETFTPIGGIGYLFTEVLKREHNSKFIFTCRPFIKEAGINFYQISLGGLTFDDCVQLFRQYKVSVNESDLIDFSRKSHTLTKGHPLWLNLIAAQANRGLDIANNFIDNIKNKTDFNEDNFSAIMSQKILSQVWESLNEKQRVLLRGIAETVKPETIQNLKQILDSELKNHQFDRAFKTLKNLSLIEIKTSSISDDQIELHPLVKEFIVSKYHRLERTKFITLLVRYYDKVIYVLKPKLNSDMPLSAFQNWTSKIELEINKQDFPSALLVLHEVCSPILSAGFSEEYLRVSEMLFDSINWKEAIEKEFAYFHYQLSILTRTATNYGKFERSELYLSKYETLIPGKSSYYLNYCSEKCYLYWHQEMHDEAILIGEKGEFLLDNSGLADHHSLRHNLALARRDSKIKENIEKALVFFLSGENLDEIIDINSIRNELGGAFYGNIGRCLYYMGEIDNTLKCYFISLKLLLTSDDKELTKLNVGYAYSWIADVLLSKNKVNDGLHFLMCSMNTWETVSPYKVKKLKKKWDDVVCDIETKNLIQKKLDWQLQKFCTQKMDEYLNA